MTKEITAALCKFLEEVPSLTSMTTARIQTKNGKGYEFDFAELGYICSVINPILSKNGLHIYHYDEYIDGQEILASTIYHISGESLPTSRKLIPKGLNQNPLYEYGSAKTYFRRYVTLGMLNLWHGVDDAGKEYNPDIQENKDVGMPTILDKETKDHYLKKVGDMYLNRRELYEELADAVYEEFGFDKTKGKFGDYITEPKHITYIQTWLNAFAQTK